MDKQEESGILLSPDDGSANYPVPQQTLADALKNLAMEPRETITKLKVKAGEMGETTQLVVLERQ